MNSSLPAILLIALQTGATDEEGKHFVPTGRESKSQDEQRKAILAAQAKREKRAAKIIQRGNSK